jgi:hypothetical protein
LPLYNPRTVTALGARVGNYKYHPFWNVLLDQLWFRWRPVRAQLGPIHRLGSFWL